MNLCTSLIIITLSASQSCVFSFSICFSAGVQDSCRCVGGQLTAAGLCMRSIINTVSHLYFIMSTQLCPSLYSKKKKKKKIQRSTSGGWGDHYNTVEGRSVSRLNLKWKAFHIRFLWKIPFHTYTNNSVPCSTVSAICFYLLRWLMVWVSCYCFFILFFSYFCPYWEHVSGNPWYAIEVNVRELQSWSKHLVRSVTSKRTAFLIQCRDIDFSIF